MEARKGNGTKRGMTGVRRTVEKDETGGERNATRHGTKDGSRPVEWDKTGLLRRGNGGDDWW